MLALERSEPVKSGSKLSVELPEQFHLRGCEIALRGCTHDRNRANEPLVFPEKENHAVTAVMRRQIAPIEDRFGQAASIGKKVANSDESFARPASNKSPEWLDGEEAVRQWPGFSHNRGQNRIVLKRHPDQLVRNCSGKQSAGGLPERIDICRPVEAEQRPLDFGINDSFALHIQPANAPVLARSPSCLSDFRPCVLSKKPERSEIKKYNLSYVAIGNRALRLSFKRKEK